MSGSRTKVHQPLCSLYLHWKTSQPLPSFEAHEFLARVPDIHSQWMWQVNELLCGIPPACWWTIGYSAKKDRSNKKQRSKGHRFYVLKTSLLKGFLGCAADRGGSKAAEDTTVWVAQRDTAKWRKELVTELGRDWDHHHHHHHHQDEKK